MITRFRTQFDEPLEVGECDFPPSVVQSGMSPSIASMVRTRSVGGNLGEYEMDGIDSDAPFDSEYYDFFDIQDMIANRENDSNSVDQGKESEESLGQENPNDIQTSNNQDNTES